MKNKIICQKGKCYEENSIETEFESIFMSGNIVDEIQHELIKKSIR